MTTSRNVFHFQPSVGGRTSDQPGRWCRGLPGIFRPVRLTGGPVLSGAFGPAARCRSRHSANCSSGTLNFFAMRYEETKSGGGRRSISHAKYAIGDTPQAAAAASGVSNPAAVRNRRNIAPSVSSIAMNFP
jgi:hypothetical protein